MKIISVSTLVVLLFGLGLLVTLKRCHEDDTIEAYSVKEAHSYVYSSDVETFNIPFLINQKDTIYTLEDALVRSVIKCKDTEDLVPIDLVDISFIEMVDFMDLDFYSYQFVFKIGVYAEDLIINIDDARLHLSYQTGQTSVLDIGSFNYSFESENSEHLRMHTRFNIHQHFNQYPSSVGLVFSLENKTQRALEITNISFNSQVEANMKYLRPFDGEIDAFLTLEEALGKPVDLMRPSRQQRHPIILEAEDTQMYVVPFAYAQRFEAMHRYPIIVEYLYEEAIHRMVIDDFMFIRTKPFHVYHEALHREVTFYAED